MHWSQRWLCQKIGESLSFPKMYYSMLINMFFIVKNHWQPYFMDNPRISEFILKCCLLLITNDKSKYIYWDCSSSIFNCLKYSLHDYLPLIPTIILIILFCSLENVLLW
jgi:hypothetical protein